MQWVVIGAAWLRCHVCVASSDLVAELLFQQGFHPLFGIGQPAIAFSTGVEGFGADPAGRVQCLALGCRARSG